MKDLDVEVGLDDSLIEAGLDSLGEMRLAAWAHQQLGIPRSQLAGGPAVSKNLKHALGTLSEALLDLMGGIHKRFRTATLHGDEQEHTRDDASSRVCYRTVQPITQVIPRRCGAPSQMGLDTELKHRLPLRTERRDRDLMRLKLSLVT